MGTCVRCSVEVDVGIGASIGVRTISNILVFLLLDITLGEITGEPTVCRKSLHTYVGEMPLWPSN